MRPKRPFRRADQDKFLDMLMAIAIMILLVALMFRESRIILNKASMANAFSVLDHARTDLSEHFAIHGGWPQHMSIKDIRSDKQPDMDAQDGVLTIAMKNHNVRDAESTLLSMRPATMSGESADVIVWICGRHSAPEGFQSSGKDRTNLEAKELYAICR
jgi:hypothetical protein